jgi:hypothetical protein
MLIIEIHVDEYENKNASTHVSHRGTDDSTVKKEPLNPNLFYLIRDLLKEWWISLREHKCQSNGL